MDENLIGYLFNALDEAERREVEARLSLDPEARSRLEMLRRALAPLATDAESPEPPHGLVISTLARVAEAQCRPLPQAPAPRRHGVPWRSLRRADVLAAACLLLFFGALFATWIVQGWNAGYQARCENNMRRYWEAMTQYSDGHEGAFPKVPDHGPQSFAGMFVPILSGSGFLSDDHLACEGTDHRCELPPTAKEVEELWQQADQAAFQRRARQLAGNYAYSLGYRDGAGVRGPRRGDNPYRPILADHHPNPGGPSNSPNHGGRGQNVLFTDGHVRFLTTPLIGGDNMYLNRENKVLAGVDADDIVLGAGDAAPNPRD
jgi:prepilin-type processing-associated H-X9-DG protein